MNQFVKEENEHLICVRHQDKIIKIIQDNSVPFANTFLCSTCVDEVSTIPNNTITLSEAKALVDERSANLDCIKEIKRNQLSKSIEIFQEKVNNIRSQLISQLDEILRFAEQWILDLQNFGGKKNQMHLIQELESLYLKQDIFSINEDELEIKKSQDLIQTFNKLLSIESLQSCFDSLRDIERDNEKSLNEYNKQQSPESQAVKLDQLQPITCQQIESVKYKDVPFAVAFNGSGTIMVAGCNEEISLWRFDKGNLSDNRILKGHTETVSSFVFSKKFNWFASGSKDETIRCWKQQMNNDWVSCYPQSSHTDYIQCLILNCNEDQLISCSDDNSIKVWDVNCEQNYVMFGYTLENKHTDKVYGITLNQSNTALVSCSHDNQIILWTKGQDQQWKYQNNVIKDDFGYRITFISDNQVAWQQQGQGITHIFEIADGNLNEKPELRIKLDEENDDVALFPTIFNRRRQVMIQKHSQYVYIIRKQKDGKLKIESDPIECTYCLNYGGLTEDGQYLVIWNMIVTEFRIYKITYG